VPRVLKLLKQLIGSGSSGQKIRVRLLEAHVEGDYLNVQFEMPGGEKPTAKFRIKDGDTYSEAEGLSDFFGADSASELVGVRFVSVNMSRFPQFVDSCESPPSRLMVEAANQPNIIKKTEVGDDEILSMRELLYRRFREIDGVSDREARRMADNESLDMGDLSTLKVPEDRGFELERNH
jgi:hypothetical protein